MAGGLRTYVFAKYLVKIGHKVNIITSYRDKNIKKYKSINQKKINWHLTNENGIKVHWLNNYYSNHMTFFQRLKSFVRFAYFSTQKALTIKTDIVFATSTPLTIAIPAVFASRKHKVPMIFEVRDVWPQIPIALKIFKNPILCYLANTLEKWAYNNASSIITLSPDMKKSIVSKNKISPKTIAVIPNLSNLNDFKYNKKIELDFRKNHQWLIQGPILLYAGSFGKVNNLEYVINLAKSLKKINSKIKILLIGEGKYKESLIISAKKNDLYEKNLFFKKSFSRNIIKEYFMSATMCANFVIDVKETWANSANKFFDTLAAGKPVLINHGGWMKDLILHYECGICIHGIPIDKAAEKLNYFMLNKKWLKMTGNNSFKLAKNFFDQNILSKQFAEVINLTKNKREDMIEKIAPGIYY
jgi:glycosyltransferase involved in cell wall biosynthesis